MKLIQAANANVCDADSAAPANALENLSTIPATPNVASTINNSDVFTVEAHETLPVPYPAPHVSKDLTVWAISDHAKCRERLSALGSEAPWSRLQVINFAEIESMPMHFVNRLQTEMPDLVWVMLPYLASGSSPPLSKTQTALRVVLQQQMQSGRQICVEGVTTSPSSRGFYMPAIMFEQYARLQCHPVWWCSLGVTRSNQTDSKIDCVNRLTATTFPLPSRYLSCCGRYSRKRGVKPKRNPNLHFHQHQSTPCPSRSWLNLHQYHSKHIHSRPC